MLEKIMKKPWTIKSEAKRLADLHFHIHSFKCEKLPSQRDNLINNILKVDLLSDCERDSIIKYLEKIEINNTICHGDFHPDNIIITKEGPLIIDWLTGSNGDSKADVVRTLLILKYGTVPPGISKIKRVFFYLLRSIFYHVYLKRYLHKSKTKEIELEKWMLPMAAARLNERLPEAEKKILLELIKKKSLIND